MAPSPRVSENATCVLTPHHATSAATARSCTLCKHAYLQYLESIGFPRTEESGQVIADVCSAVERSEGLKGSAEFSGLFLPKFHEHLTKMQKKNGTGTAESSAAGGDVSEKKDSSAGLETVGDLQNLLASIDIGGATSKQASAEGAGETKVPSNGRKQNKSDRGPRAVFGALSGCKEVGEDAWTNDLQLEGAWSKIGASLFKIRGPRYLKDKAKVHSDFSIYEPVGLEYFATAQRYICASDALWMSKVPVEEVVNGMPTRLTVEITFPNFPSENAVFGRQKHNGPSHMWIIALELSEAAKRQLRGDEEMSPGLKLARRFVDKNDPEHSAFKTIFHVANIKEPGFPDLGMITNKLFANYNGKPYLSNKSHRTKWVSNSFFAYVCWCSQWNFLAILFLRFLPTTPVYTSHSLLCA